jgi:hypothetical protein
MSLSRGPWLLSLGVVALLFAGTAPGADVTLVRKAPPGSPPKTGSQWACRSDVPLSELEVGFSQPDMFYAPFTFWFWDAPLDPGQVAYQAREMCAQRLNPGYAHGRHGLPKEQWLSPVWFASLDAALDVSEKAGMYLGYCDEYWWPSGQAAGRVLKAHPELAAQSLSWTTTDTAAGQRVRLPGSFFTVAAQLAADGAIRSSTLKVIGKGAPFSWTAPEGKWRIYSFSKYHHAGSDGSPINYLDARLPKAFMDIAYEPYARHFGSRMGKNLCGIFMDSEGDYGWNLAWSEHLAASYQKRKGRDIRLWMPLLFETDAEGKHIKARFDWFDVMSDIYSNEYFGALSRWAERHRQFFTMHIWEEGLPVQSRSDGDYFALQKAVSFPGNDSLVRKPLEVHDFKESQSVAEFQGRQFMSEVMGVIGWDVTPAFMKQAVNAVITWGVSHVMPHGINLNRDLNAIPYPPDFFTENPYWPYMHLWADFTRRASYVNSHGRLAPDVLLYHPIESVWVLTGQGMFDTPGDNDTGGLTAPKRNAWSQESKHIESVYSNAINQLAAARIEYLVADRSYLRQMSVKDSYLTLDTFSFKSLILPPLTVLPLDVARKIVEFAKAGGGVYLLGELPEASTDSGAGDPQMLELMTQLRAQPGVVDLGKDGLAAELAREGTRLVPQVIFTSGQFPMLETHRRIGGTDCYWLANNTGIRHDCELLFSSATGAASIWDCESGEIRPVASKVAANGSTVRLGFGPYEGYWLAFDPSKAVQPGQTTTSETEVTQAIQDTWHVKIPTDGQPSPAPQIAKFFTTRWRASWLKCDGVTSFRQQFNLQGKPVNAELRITAVPSFHLWVNGKEVPGSSWDQLWQQVRTIDIAGMLEKGMNTIAVSAGATEGMGGVIWEGRITLRDGEIIELASEPATVRCTPDLSRTAYGRWIWCDAPKEQQTVYFRRTFDIPPAARIRRASMAITADDRFELWVNGQKLGAQDSWEAVATFDLAHVLVPGKNAIVVRAVNRKGPAGLLVGMPIVLADGNTRLIQSDTEWTCTDKNPTGQWRSIEYDDSEWVKAASTFNYGEGPWGARFVEFSLGSREWVAPGYGDSSWHPAVSLGVPPVEPWLDVPVDLLAGTQKPLESWLDWGLDQFSGYADYSTTFTRDGTVTDRLMLDLGKVKYMAEVWVNDRNVGARLWAPFEFDITSAVRPGVNKLRVRVGNLVVNEMAQFAHKRNEGSPRPRTRPKEDAYDAGLFGPVRVREARRVPVISPL